MNKNSKQSLHSKIKNSKLFSYVCHQIPDRCVRINATESVFCVRCNSLYVSFFLSSVALLSMFGIASFQMNNFLVAVLFTPIAVDGLTQWIGIRESNPTLRFFTGSLAGFGLSLLLFSSLGLFFSSNVRVIIPSIILLKALIPITIVYYVIHLKKSEKLLVMYNWLIIVSFIVLILLTITLFLLITFYYFL